MDQLEYLCSNQFIVPNNKSVILSVFPECSFNSMRTSSISGFISLPLRLDLLDRNSCSFVFKIDMLNLRLDILDSSLDIVEFSVHIIEFTSDVVDLCRDIYYFKFGIFH